MGVSVPIWRCKKWQLTGLIASWNGRGSFEAQKQGLLVLMEPNEGDPCRPLQESDDFYTVKISVQMFVIMSK